jgi:acyl-coenzyme A thioesterase PaaI-like protein
MSDNSVSFPAFHERTGQLSESDMARVRLAERVRELIYTSFMSTAEIASVDAAIAEVERAIDHLSADAVPGSAASESHFSDRSPFYGAMNPLSMPMEMGRDESVGEFGAIIGNVVFTEPYEGPPGHCHGGFIAAAFDEVLGMAQSLTGRPGMTGKLSITYRSPTPLHTNIVFRGWVDRVDGRKIFTKGSAHNGDTLCAEAEVLFLSMPPEMMDMLRKGRDLSAPKPE